MRFIEFKDGHLLLSPRRSASHRDMLQMARRRREDVASAGFLPARYSQTEPWVPYGVSIGLEIGSDNKELQFPKQFFVAKHRYGLLFASAPDMLHGLQDIAPAQWGMTNEGAWGDAPVYAPLHPDHPLTADQVTTD